MKSPPSRIMIGAAYLIGSPVLLGLATTWVPPLPSAVCVDEDAVPLDVPVVVVEVDFPDSDVVESLELLLPDEYFLSVAVVPFDSVTVNAPSAVLETFADPRAVLDAS